jgi:flavin-dependent dehydrogenase
MVSTTEIPAAGPAAQPDLTCDVAILGGAFSGAALGLLLMREHPHARILIIEKTTGFDRKVGESTSEVAGCFLTKVLGLSHYLAHAHYQKHGLRLWFTTPDNECPNCCTEIGPSGQSRLPTFQIDRAQLDQHLLDRAVAAGCELLRPATVKSFDLGGAGHNLITIKRDGITSTIRAAWVADCSGRAALIARQRGTLHPLDEHPVHSMWVRFRNVCDLDSPQAHQAATALHDAATWTSRTSATNHLMGYGWWSWIIPLANGDFSAGVTWDERMFTPPADGPLGARVQRHLVSHPIGRLMFANAVPVENDARVYKHLPYFSNEVAGDGWLIVGDAAGFMDPLYSQGLDYCSHGISIARDILGRALDGQCVAGCIARHNHQFVESYHRWFHALYRNKYEYLGDADLMHAAFLLDIGAYFVGPVRLIYQDTVGEFAKMPYNGAVGRGFAALMAFYNRRLAVLARKRLARGTYGRHNLHRRHFIRRPFLPTLAAFRHLCTGLAAWGRLEFTHALIRSTPPPAPVAQQPPARQPATPTPV